MKFLLDECTLGKTKKVLTRLGFSVITVFDLGKASAADPEILRLAKAREAVLVTTDLDFSDLILYPLGSHRGIIVLRLRPDEPGVADEVNLVLERLLKEIPPSSIENSLVIVDRNKYRLRQA